MTQAEVERIFAKLDDAIARDDENAGREAAIALVSVVIISALRIADALDHIARNLPAAK